MAGVVLSLGQRLPASPANWTSRAGTALGSSDAARLQPARTKGGSVDHTRNSHGARGSGYVHARQIRRIVVCPLKRECVDGSALARTFCTSQVWSGQPCVRRSCAVYVTADQNALRGSGAGQNRIRDALAL